MSILSILSGRRPAKYDPHASGEALVNYAGAQVAEAADALGEANEHFAASKARETDTITALSSAITEAHQRHERSHQAQRASDDLLTKIDYVLGVTSEV